MERFVDGKVKDFLDSDVHGGVILNGVQRVFSNRRTAIEIAARIGRSPKSVARSLERLHRKDKAAKEGELWSTVKRER
jgi:hypothetical protein